MLRFSDAERSKGWMLKERYEESEAEKAKSRYIKERSIKKEKNACNMG